jgi:RNA recognition motif-containing protein
MQIYVGNLAYTTTDQELRQVFEVYGVVARVQIPQDRETGRPRGFGFVEMADDRAAQAAITGLHGKEVAGRTLNVNEARQREERGPRSGGFREGGPRGGGGRRW